jgi:hypothetical protein
MDSTCIVVQSAEVSSCFWPDVPLEAEEPEKMERNVSDMVGRGTRDEGGEIMMR